MKSTAIWGNEELKTTWGLSLESLTDTLRFYAAVVQIGTYTHRTKDDRGRDKGQESKNHIMGEEQFNLLN